MKYLIQNKFWNIAEDYNKEKLLYLLVDRPTEIDSYGDFIWLNNENEWHRNYDLPAYIWHDYSVFWYKQDKRHREHYKPANISIYGQKDIYICGVFSV